MALFQTKRSNYLEQRPKHNDLMQKNYLVIHPRLKNTHSNENSMKVELRQLQRLTHLAADLMTKFGPVSVPVGPELTWNTAK